MPEVYSAAIAGIDHFLDDFDYQADIHSPASPLPPNPETDNLSDFDESDNVCSGTEAHSFRSASKSNSDPVAEADIMVDDIRTEFHPHSNQRTRVEHFDDYGREDASARRSFQPKKKPWRPFRTRLDFEVAELVLETAMNSKQITTLISLLQRCALGAEKFTIHSYKDLQKTWEQSSVKSVGVWVILLYIPSYANCLF